MRLLTYNTRGEISFTKDFSEQELLHHRYAILSHKWSNDEEEVTYDDVLSGIGTTKEGIGAVKVRFCVKQAERDGLRYFWIDTCCIDRSNSTELSTAIQSMFRWYANSTKCYTFLADVERKEDLRFSIWFTRGWALQELIAPTELEFFCKSGHSLGTKISLDVDISEITKIPILALRGGERALTDFPLHERRQWQQGRQTQKPEDLMYSLLGMLGVSMPILYGEGIDSATERLEHQMDVMQKGVRHRDFTLPFTLAKAAIETHDFVARREELFEMRDYLNSNGERRAIVLCGLGGIGKTQLALAYAKRHRHNHSAMIWLNARSEDSIKLSYAAIAKQIVRYQPETAKKLVSMELNTALDNVMEEVKYWLDQRFNTRWLMICDNYDNPPSSAMNDPMAFDLRQYLPEAYQGSIIVTTRSSEVKLGKLMRVTKLSSLSDSLAILENTSGRKKLADDSSAVELAKVLDGLPLALATAGAYLSQSDVTFAKYLDFFNQSWARLQQTSPALMSYENGTLYSTWQISYDQIRSKNEMSANLLRLWAYLDGQDMWYELLSHTDADHPDWLNAITDELTFQACMRVLCEHGLVEANIRNQYDFESKGYSVHSCVHAWMSTVLNAKKDDDMACNAWRCVAWHIPRTDARHWPYLQRRLLPHANSIVIYLDSASQRSNTYWAISQIARFISERENLQLAEVLYTRLLYVERQQYGENHSQTMSTARNLAMTYQHQGRLQEAEHTYMKVLELRESELGAEDELTLSVVCDLGLVYQAQGKLDRAEETLDKVLKAKESTPDTDQHLKHLVLHALGSLYTDQERYSEAEIMLLRALSEYEARCGPEHMFTLHVVNSIGALYRLQQRYDESEVMLQRAYDGYKKTLGPQDNTTLDAVLNLGNLAFDRNLLEEAESKYLSVLHLQTEKFGKQHRTTLRTISNVGFLSVEMGKYSRARQMLEQSKACLDSLDFQQQKRVHTLEKNLNEAEETARMKDVNMEHVADLQYEVTLSK